MCSPYESDSTNAYLYSIFGIEELNLNCYADPSTLTPLMKAASSGDVEAVQNALRHASYHVNNTNNQGLTAVHFAVINKHVEVVRLLVETEEINIDAQDRSGMTPLMYACQEVAPLDIIQCLLQNGCNVNMEDHNGLTALWHVILELDELDPAVIEMLTNHGADINAVDDGNSPIQYVLKLHMPGDIAVAVLLYYGADPSFPSVSFNIFEIDPDAYNMILPYFSLCDLNVLEFGSIQNIIDIWDFQCRYDRLELAEVLTHSLDAFMDKLFESLYSFDYYSTTESKIKLFNSFTTFVYELYDSKELRTVMHTETNGLELQHRLTPASKIYTTVFTDKFVADLLRLALCNYNCLYDYTHCKLLTSLWSPIETIKIMEEFNVPILYGTNHNEKNISNTWQMYIQPSHNLKNEANLCTSRLSMFYRSSEDTKPRSLVELCRNVVRDQCLSITQSDPTKPYRYATIIKALLCPKIIQDILLLRKPIYS